MTAVSVALPIPAGVFFPVFLIGKELFSWFITLIGFTRAGMQRWIWDLQLPTDSTLK